MKFDFAVLENTSNSPYYFATLVNETKTHITVNAYLNVKSNTTVELKFSKTQNKQLLERNPDIIGLIQKQSTSIAKRSTAYTLLKLNDEYAEKIELHQKALKKSVFLKNLSSEMYSMNDDSIKKLMELFPEYDTF